MEYAYSPPGVPAALCAVSKVPTWTGADGSDRSTRRRRPQGGPNVSSATSPSVPPCARLTECVLPSDACGSANRPSQWGADGSVTSSMIIPRSQYDRYAVRPSALSATLCKNAWGIDPRHAGAHIWPVPTFKPASRWAPQLVSSTGWRGSVTSTTRRSPRPLDTSELGTARYAYQWSPRWPTVNSC